MWLNRDGTQHLSSMHADVYVEWNRRVLCLHYEVLEKDSLLSWGTDLDGLRMPS